MGRCLGRWAALGRQSERGALTQRDALVRRVYHRKAVAVHGMVRPGHYEWEALEAAVRRVPQIEQGPGSGSEEKPSGMALQQNGPEVLEEKKKSKSPYRSWWLEAITASEPSLNLFVGVSRAPDEMGERTMKRSSRLSYQEQESHANVKNIILPFRQLSNLS